MKVIGPERGPRLTTQDFNPHDEPRHLCARTAPEHKRQLRPGAQHGGARSRCRCLVKQPGRRGTVHYGAVSWRFHEDDFRARSQTIERYGVRIPADLTADWPLSYADLEPY
jgi:gluconate 2-dehydrogenase alpha chain